MNKIVFIKDNSPEIRNKLREAGFSICVCANFKNSIWLTYHPNGSIHGEGYADENDSDAKYSPLKRIEMRLKEDDYYSEKREFYDTVEEFLEKYKA